LFITSKVQITGKFKSEQTRPNAIPEELESSILDKFWRHLWW